jgi:hypothetical protein
MSARPLFTPVECIKFVKIMDALYPSAELNASLDV